MIMMRAVLFVCAAVLGVAWAPAAEAAERDYWKHGKGHFENTMGNKWEEKSDSHTYHFVEKERKEKYIELYDKSRDMTVHLYDDRAVMKKGDGKFQKYYDGMWGKR